MELQVPDEAVATLRVCDADSHLHDRAEGCVRAIAAPVTAAAFRAFADELDGMHGPAADTRDKTTARDDTLDEVAAKARRWADDMEGER